MNKTGKFKFNTIEKIQLLGGASNFTKAYLRHLVNCNEILAGELLSIHNIRFLLKLVEDAREAIKADRFADFKREFYEKYYGK